MTMLTTPAPATMTAHAPALPARNVRPPEDFCLPRGYVQQTAAFTHDAARGLEDAPGEDYWNPERIAASGRWQRHVYTWGARLVRNSGMASVLDIGCGPGTKLAGIIAPVCADIEGIDQPSAVAAAKRMNAPGRYSVVDLESCENVEPWRTFDLILCADVIEHLLDPDPMLGLIRRFCHERSLVLISTPDRARLRGRACMSSEKPEHVREWTTPEFTRYLRSRRFDIESVRLLPGDDAPARRGIVAECLWSAGLGATSPHRCLTVLCRPSGA